MGTAERRLEILKYLCRKRHVTMYELSEEFGVSIRTIHRDIYEIEITFRVPLQVKAGKYQGGVYVVGDYSFDRMYMTDAELELLKTIKNRFYNELTDYEIRILDYIISCYTKPSIK